MTSVSGNGGDFQNRLTVRNAFGAIKKRDKNAQITKQDLLNGQGNLTGDATARFQAADKNGNGKLSLGDWLRFKKTTSVGEIASYVGNDPNLATKKGAKQIGLPADDFQNLSTRGDKQDGISMADITVNGTLGFGKANDRPRQELYEKRFKRFNKDNDDVLSQSEYEKMRGFMTNQRLAKLFVPSSSSSAAPSSSSEYSGGSSGSVTNTPPEDASST